MAVAIAPIIATAIGVTAATAAIIAEVVVIAVGLGISLLSQLLFKPAQPKPSDVQTIIKQATAPRFRVYGRAKIGGILMFANTKGGVLDRVIAMGSGEIDAVEEHWIDDHLATVDLGGNVTSPSQYVGHCRLEFRLGTAAPAAYSNLTTAWPALWTSAHLGKGIPSAFMEMFQVKSEQMGDIWPQYANTLYRQVQRGAKIRTVSGGVLSAPVWNDLASNVILDYLTHPDGLNLDDSWIQNEIASWEIAQNTCSEPIALAAGGVENRYRIWNTYRFDERPAEVLARFLQACDGTIYPTPNRGIAIKVGKWEAPTVTIDDDAILGFSEFGRGRDVLTTANTIRARYTSSTHDYLETDADPWVDAADVAARGEFATDMDLFAAPSHAQTRRLMKLNAARANPAWVGRLSCNLRALPAMGERFVNVEIAELGITGSFEVLNVQLTIEGTILKGVEIQIASLAAAAYDWTTVEEGTAPGEPAVIVPDNTIPIPTGVIASILTITGTEARVAWDDPPVDYLEGEVRYRPVGAAEWLAQPVAAGATATVIFNIAPGIPYEIEVRFRSSTTDRVTGWVSAGSLASAAVDLNFASDEYFQQSGGSTLAAIVTVARASTGYASDLAGVWTSFAANIARRTNRGLLVEEARTNVVRNNSMQGAVAGTPGTLPTNWTVASMGGLTQTVVGTGTTGGIDYIDIRLQGTNTQQNPNISFEVSGGVAAATGQDWNLSTFLAIVGGTNIPPLRYLLTERTSGGGLVLSNVLGTSVITLTGTLTRYSETGTLSGGATTAFVVPTLRTTLIIGSIIDITIRIGWPQLERGSFATSPIRTTSLPVTRNADLVTLTSPTSFAAAYTLFGDGTPAAPTGIATVQSLIAAGDGIGNERWSAGRASGVARAQLTAGGTSATISGGAWAANTSGKIAAAYAVSDQAYSFGGAAAVAGFSVLAPSGLNTVRIGNADAGTDQWNGYVERVIVWPNVRLPNAELQRLTT